MSALTEPWMDDLETQLLAAAGRVTVQLRRKRRSRRVAGLAIAAVLLVGGGALAATTPFHPLAAFESMLGAQREVTSADAVPPAVRAQFERSMVGVKGLQLDEARLMATLPGGAAIYAAPTAEGQLCSILTLGHGADGAAGCGPPLGPDVPIRPMMFSARGQPTIVAGFARDDVRAVSVLANGVLQTIAVHDNAFSYQGAPGTSVELPFAVQLDDGTTSTFPLDGAHFTFPGNHPGPP